MNDDLHSLAAAYALDALDDDERTAFEAHLAECASCSLAVADQQAAAALLVPDDELVGPPPDLKARVMAQIADTAQLPPVASDPVAPQVPPASPVAPAPPATQHAEPSTATPLRRRSEARPPWIALAAAAVVVVVLGFGAVMVLGGDGGTPNPDRAELAAELLEAPDAVTVELQGDTPGTVQVLYSETEGRAVVVGDGLDAPGDDRVYQLWTISGDQPTPSETFTPDGGELGEEFDLTVDPPDAWAITIEPAGGSTAPTGDILFQGTPA